VIFTKHKRSQKGGNIRMRKVPVLTVVSLVVCGLMVVSAQAATLFGNETPDIKLAPGTTGDNVFDLDDFFDGPGTVTYSATGGSVGANGMASVLGDANPGMKTASFTATAGAETVTVDSQVYITQVNLGNDPMIDDNNRIVGMDGNNVFFNAIVPGQTVNSAKALTNLPQGGGSPGGVTGGAALIATIGQVTLNQTETGLVQRSSSVAAQGTGGTVSAGGLTATLNADGTYSLAAANNFSGAWIVTLGASSGANVDAVHLLAAAAQAVTLDAASVLAIPAGTNPQAQIAYNNGQAVVTAAAGQGILVVANNAATVGEYATVSLNYNASGPVSIAVIGFDGGLDGSAVFFANPSGGNVATGVTKNLATSVRPVSGSVLAGFQIVNAGSASATVTISNLVVASAGPVTNYALNPNAKAYDNSLVNTTGLLPDIAASGAKAPTASTENNFTSAAGAGSISLEGVGGSGIANAAAQVALGDGTAVGEAFVKRMGTAAAGSVLALVVTDGVSQFGAFTPGGSVPETFRKFICSGTYSAATTAFFVVQAAGFNAVVDDLSVRIVTDTDNMFDANLF
jgi:hypothetical protein